MFDFKGKTQSEFPPTGLERMLYSDTIILANLINHTRDLKISKT